MTICYFGIYNPEYSRNRILIKGLKQNGVKVIECNSRLQGVRKYFDLIKKHWRLRGKYDVMIVGFPGYQAMILARFLTRRPIIFDAFTSIYDSLVLDRKITSPYSLKAKYYYFLDWLSCRLADKILSDTAQNIQYFSKNFKVKYSKFIRVFVGVDEEIMKPIKEKDKIEHKQERDYFLVHFHGSYIPLQGVEYILAAAKILEKKNIKFNIIGSKIKEKFSGQSYPNVNFINNVSYKELRDLIVKTDVSLGIFGDTEKTKRVIPNKVFEAVACGCPVITADTPAIKELFIDGKNIILCPAANSQALAQKILKLKNDKFLRENIAKEGYNLFKDKLTSKMVTKIIYEQIFKNCGD